MPRLVSLHHVLALWRRAAAVFEKDPDWPHPERAMNRINDRHREEMVAHIEAKIEGRPDLIAKSMPNYPPYGKRILLDNGWYDAIRKDNVTCTMRVARFTENEIIGDKGP